MPAPAPRLLDPPARAAPPPLGTAAPPAAPAVAGRVDGVDLVRGLVVALMVLDHVREYWSDTALVFSPTDLARTTPVLFATRWVTHLCAPTFVFLAGASVYLQWAAASARGGGDAAARRAVRRGQVARGLWLAALELTVVSFGFNFGAPFLFFQVIWAIGVGLVCLTPLVGRRPAVAAGVGAAALVGGNLLAAFGTPLVAGAPPAAGLAWRLLFAPGPAAPLPGLAVYPLVPWFGVLCLGYAAGPLFLRAPAPRRRALVGAGAGALAAFVALRAVNVGDFAAWRPQAAAAYTLLSFLNVSKYPPSPLFVLATLGVTLPLCALLPALGGWFARLAAPLLRAFGRTPMLTYLVHVYLVHGSAMLAGVAAGVPAAAFTHFLESPEALREAGWGVGLPAVYVVWLLTCLALFPLARWYADLRARRPAWWMRYL